MIESFYSVFDLDKILTFRKEIVISFHSLNRIFVLSLQRYY